MAFNNKAKTKSKPKKKARYDPQGLEALKPRKADFEKAAAEAIAILEVLQKHFAGQELHGGDEVLELVTAKLAEMGHTVRLQLGTVMNKYYFILLGEVVLGDPEKGSFKLRVYTWKDRIALDWFLQPMLKYN